VRNAMNLITIFTLRRVRIQCFDVSGSVDGGEVM
jgi:hypothetical protein